MTKFNIWNKLTMNNSIGRITLKGNKYVKGGKVC